MNATLRNEPGVLDRSLSGLGRAAESVGLVETPAPRPGRTGRGGPGSGRAARLMFYLPALAGGGAERVWTLLASNFAARGYDVICVVDFDLPDNDGFLSPAVRRHTLSGGHWATTRQLADVIRREDPDVMLSAISVANVKLMTAAALAGRLDGVVLSYHGYRESEPKRLSSLGYVLTPVSTRVARRTIAVSHGLRRYLIERCHASARRVEMVPNPIPVERIPCATAADLAARPPLVLGIGRLVRYKGFDVLIDAFSRLRTPGAELVILGEGEERPALERQIMEAGLSGRVHLPGYVREPWEWLGKARCLVSSSRTEAFGNVVVEALAAGLPVVSTACHGPVEILVNGRYGELVKVDDAAAMAAAIDRGLADLTPTDDRRRRAEAFKVEAAVDEYERLVAHVMIENGRAG